MGESYTIAIGSRVMGLKEAIGAKFQYMSWPQFVEMVINNELPRHPELASLTVAGAGIVTPAAHWAPYWLHCGLCRPELRPKYILQVEKLGEVELVSLTSVIL